MPGHLRGYGGGWALDTVMALPAMVLVREHGIPHSRLPVPYRLPTGDPAGLIPGTARYLEMMLSLPRAEGNVLRAMARNLTTFQTAARGTGAEALDFVVETLAARLVGPALRGGISSAHGSDADAGFGATVIGMVRGLNQSGSGVPAFRPILFDNQSAWDTALAVPLARLAEHDEPVQGLRALGARGSAVATTIRDGIGAERAGALLAMLRDRHANAGYDAGTLPRLRRTWMRTYKACSAIGSMTPGCRVSLLPRPRSTASLIAKRVSSATRSASTFVMMNQTRDSSH